MYELFEEKISKIGDSVLNWEKISFSLLLIRTIGIKMIYKPVN